jgi:hypothetical protein
VKLPSVFLVTAIFLVSVSLFTAAFAQSAQVSYTVKLSLFALNVSYPSEVMPGDNVTITIQGSPTTSNVYLQSLSIIVYYADATGLHQLISQTLISNPTNSYAYYGTSTTANFTKSLTVNVPQDAPRTSLVALFSETTQSNNYYYNDFGPYPFSYYRDPIFYSYYPSYSTETDQAISPLSYVKATTPEFVTLQSEYQQLQQQMNQAQTQNQQLQASITQQNSTIRQLNQQLTTANTTAQTYQTIAVVFAIIAVALAALSIYEIIGKGKAKTISETKSTN